MKTFTNKKELKELGACADGYQTFINVHGDNDAKLSQCLESNGWYDTWWLIGESYDQFSDSQKKDLRLLGCEYALSCIDNFEKEFTEDKRPRRAIEASIKFANGEIGADEIEAAESAAWSAAESAWSARSAAWSAAWSAAESAWSAARLARSAARSAAWSAAWSAAESAESQKNKQMLMNLFLKWESQVDE